MTDRAAPDWPAALRDLRRGHGWTQADLARAIGAGPNTIWRYEAGRSTPCGAYRAALARLLAGDNAPRDAPLHPLGLVTGDGFAPGAVAVAPATGCHVWRGAVNGDGAPVAQVAGRRRQLRRLVWQRAGRPLDPSIKLTTTCGNPRCLAPDHLAPIGAAPKPAPLSRRRTNPLRPILADLLPPTRPATVIERDWTILVGIRDGRSLAEIAAGLGLSRQRVDQLARKAVGTLPRRAP